MGHHLFESAWLQKLTFSCFFLLTYSCFSNITRVSSASPNELWHPSDNCDWIGSGSTSSGRFVKPVYLRCSAGRVSWRYPKGALRVVLRAPGGKDFRACFVLASNTAMASVYVGGYASPLPLFPDGGQQCVVSRAASALVFVAAYPNADFLGESLLDFVYELQPLHSYDECRPCSEEELLHHFCTADYVAKGTVTSIRNGIHETEVLVRAAKVLRDNGDRVFGGSAKEASISGHYGTLRRPLQCGTRAGRGEFLFVGRWRLGGATIACAPRWTEWLRVRQGASAKGFSECELS